MELITRTITVLVIGVAIVAPIKAQGAVPGSNETFKNQTLVEVPLTNPLPGEAEVN